MYHTNGINLHREFILWNWMWFNKVDILLGMKKIPSLPEENE